MPYASWPPEIMPDKWMGIYAKTDTHSVGRRNVPGVRPVCGGPVLSADRVCMWARTDRFGSGAEP